jgi:hypothetical protein
MRETMVSVVVLALMTLAPMLTAAAEDQAAPPRATQDQGAAAEGQSAPAKCLEAEVNPVTGHVLCVKPRGAPVDPAGFGGRALPEACGFERGVGA